jgi:hypothetical protein
MQKDTAVLRAIAIKHEIDVRTLIAGIAGFPVRGRVTRQRLNAALTEAGYPHLRALVPLGHRDDAPTPAEEEAVSA